MTVRPAVVLARLAHLALVLSALRRLRGLRPEDRADMVNVLAAERALHVAAEAIFDVGHHVLAGRGLPIPSTYREVIPALIHAGVLAPAFEARLAGLAGLRNLLVHDYGDIDATQLWAMIDTRLEDLEDTHTALAALAELGTSQP